MGRHTTKTKTKGTTTKKNNTVNGRPIKRPPLRRGRK